MFRTPVGRDGLMGRVSGEGVLVVHAVSGIPWDRFVADEITG